MNFLVLKFCGKEQFPRSFGRFAWNCRNCAFPQNFHTRKFNEIKVFSAVKVTPSNGRVLCVYATLGYSTREQLARGRFKKDYKNERNENTIMLGDFNCTMDKMDRDCGNKTQKFLDVVPTMPCQNLLWIMDLRIYEEGRTHIPLSSSATTGLLARIQDRQGLYWYKNF